MKTASSPSPPTREGGAFAITFPRPDLSVWRAIAQTTLRASLSDRVALSAAGCAFFATLALFPIMSMLVSLYGLLFDPRSVESQILLLRDLLPPQVYWLIADRLHHLVAQHHARLGVGLGLGLIGAFWSAVVGLRSMLSAICLAYGEGARPRFLRFQITALAMTLLVIASAVILLGLLVSMPALFGFVSPWAARMRLIHVASFALLTVFAGQAVAVLYRFGPAHRTRRVVTPGAVLALMIGLAASGLLTFYIDHLGTFGATYGPLGAAAGVMLWLFGNAYAVLLGAELNAQIERSRRETAG
jgi:membrane protein